MFRRFEKRFFLIAQANPTRIPSETNATFLQISNLKLVLMFRVSNWGISYLEIMLYLNLVKSGFFFCGISSNHIRIQLQTNRFKEVLIFRLV